MTKTKLRKMAQDSTRYGYFDHGSTVAATCPTCKKHVEADYSMWARDSKGKTMSKVQQARAGVLDHLNWGCGMADEPLFEQL